LRKREEWSGTGLRLVIADLEEDGRASTVVGERRASLQLG